MPPRGVIYRPRAPPQQPPSLSPDAPEATPSSLSASPNIAFPAATVSKAPSIVPAFILTKQQLVPAKKISPPSRSISSTESVDDGKKAKASAGSDTHTRDVHPSRSPSLPSSSASAGPAKSPSPSVLARHSPGNNRNAQGRVRESFLGASALSGQHHPQLVWKTVNSLPSPKKGEGGDGDQNRGKGGTRRSGSGAGVGECGASSTARDEGGEHSGSRVSSSSKKGGGSWEKKEQERQDGVGRTLSTGSKKDAIREEVTPTAAERTPDRHEVKAREKSGSGDGSAGGDRGVEGSLSQPQATPDTVQALTQTDKSKSETKVVVRLLPPSVTEEELVALLSDSALKEKIAWSRFFPGRQGDLGGDRPSRNSLWYLNFLTAEDADDFITFFHGKPFVDERHNVYKAVARLAPYQKTPRKKKPTDKREGTLEEASVYVEFLEKLNSGAPEEPPPPAPGTEELEVVVDDDGVVLSSLVLAMRQKYGVKTFVQGKPYTLATWRKRFSVQPIDDGEGSGEEEEEEEGGANPRPIPSPSKKGKSERGKGKKPFQFEGGTEKRDGQGREERKRTPTGSGYHAAAPVDGKSLDQRGASEQSRPAADTPPDVSNRGGDREKSLSARVMSRALLGIQRRPQAGGADEGEDNKVFRAGPQAAGASERRQGQTENGRRREAVHG